VLKAQEPLLKHILDELNFILNYTKEIDFDSLKQDELLQRAIVRSLEIIGEAVKQIDERFKENHDEIEWKKIAGFRDILIHRYFNIDWDIVWDIIQHKVPELREKIKKIL
jgi:uncharacterized protein with HEPN domain